MGYKVVISFLGSLLHICLGKGKTEKLSWKSDPLSTAHSAGKY